jgi:ubiquinone/menaquinone biosynthesis C-methylase UbiE
LDEVKAKACVARIAGFYNGTAITLMIDVGFRTGLWDAAAIGPATSHDLAARAGLQERYVREWLGAVTSAGIVEYDAPSGVFTLPPEHAHSLSGNGGSNRAANAPLLTYLGKHVSSVVSAFKNGGGVPYSQYRPEFTGFMDERFRREYDQFLLDGYIRKVTGMESRLQSGISVCDIGCGTGHNVNLLAKAFPRSRFTGYDIAADAIDRAREEAAKMGLTNARFEVQDATKLPDDAKFDLITTFDAVHDQANPQAALHEISRCLVPSGTYLMIDIKASSKLEKNLENPMSPYLYAVSTMHCMTVSLAENGAGLGTCWGQELALEMLTKAGLTDVEILDSTNPTNCIYVCRKA